MILQNRWLQVAAAALALVAASCARHETEPPGPGADGHVRIATWNIRYFPEDPGTDRGRVAEILAGLDADLVAVQEIRDEAALRSLVDDANARIAARAAGSARRARVYTYRLADSGGNGGLFVGYVYDSLALELSHVRTVRKLQMNSDLRPGLAARVKSRRGGLDFEVIVMHTDSGVRDHDYQNRLSFLDSLAVVLPSIQEVDRDVILLGDLNTMGREADGGLPAVTAADEIANMDGELAALGMRRLPNEPACTEYYRGRGSVLDHIVVAQATEEAPPGLSASVQGYCRDVDCAVLDSDDMPVDYVVASDHCPVVVDLLDEDLD